MSNIVLMPKLGLTMESGIITKWALKEGDKVKKGDVLLEVESDKSTVDMESEFEGTLLKQYFADGEDVPCGQKIALIGNSDEKIIEDAIPQIAINSGIKAEQNETKLLVNQSIEDKSSNTENTIYIASPRARRFARQSGIDISLIGKGSGENNRIIEKDVRLYLEKEAKNKNVRMSPLARNIVEENNVSVEGMKGSGPDGRIMKKDVLQTIEKKGKEISISETADLPKKVPLSKMRAIIARRLSESKKNTPHYYMGVSINMENFISARAKYNLLHQEKKVSMNAMLMKIVAIALIRHPDVNSSWADDGIIYYPHADVALAVATETGLITPIVRRCDQKGILEIGKELDDLIVRARNNSLKPDEYSDQTCTISNLGMYGVEEFSAIINPPASSILAISSTIDTPVAIGQTVVIKPIMKITMSGDHRVIDGAIGALFLRDLKQMLEEPFFALF